MANMNGKNNERPSRLLELIKLSVNDDSEAIEIEDTSRIEEYISREFCNCNREFSGKRRSEIIMGE